MTIAERKKVGAGKALAVKTQELPGKLGELMAEATILANSRVVPLAYIGKPEAVFAVIQYGKELGIGPMTALQNIAFINGRPSLGSELRSAVAHKHPEYAGMEIVESSEKKCVVKVYRKFRMMEVVSCFTGSFTIAEAQRAGLLSRSSDSAWSKWTKRMLFHRANAFAHQDAFPDVDTGVHTDEEMTPEQFAKYTEEYIKVDDRIVSENLERAGKPKQEDFVKNLNRDEDESPKIAPKRIRKTTKLV